MSNSEIIATYFKAIQTGDLAKIGALVSADVIWHNPVTISFPAPILALRPSSQ